MAEPKFFQTAIGQRFYMGTMPEIARQLKSIALSLEIIAKDVKTKETKKEPTCTICGKKCDYELARIHKGKIIGGECCWDDRLKITE